MLNDHIFQWFKCSLLKEYYFLNHWKLVPGKCQSGTSDLLPHVAHALWPCPLPLSQTGWGRCIVCLEVRCSFRGQLWKSVPLVPCKHSKKQFFLRGVNNILVRIYQMHGSWKSPSILRHLAHHCLFSEPEKALGQISPQGRNWVSRLETRRAWSRSCLDGVVCKWGPLSQRQFHYGIVWVTQAVSLEVLI